MPADFDPKNYQPGYGGQIDSNGNVKNLADTIVGTGEDARVKVEIDSLDVSLNASDISLGSVEIRDGVTDNRLAINSSGAIGVYIMGSIDGGTF